jgi:hypothetical protein
MELSTRAQHSASFQPCLLKGMKQQDAVADKILSGQTAGCNPTHREDPIAAFHFIKTEDIPALCAKLIETEAPKQNRHFLEGRLAY